VVGQAFSPCLIRDQVSETDAKVCPILLWITREDYTLSSAPCNVEFALLVKRTRAGIHSPNAGLIDHANVQVVMNSNLTR